MCWYRSVGKVLLMRLMKTVFYSIVPWGGLLLSMTSCLNDLRTPIGGRGPAWELNFTIDDALYHYSGEKEGRRKGFMDVRYDGLVDASFYVVADSSIRYNAFLGADSFNEYWPIIEFSLYCKVDTPFFIEGYNYQIDTTYIAENRYLYPILDPERNYVGISGDGYGACFYFDRGWYSFHLGDGDDVLYSVKFSILSINKDPSQNKFTVHTSGELILHKRFFVQEYDDLFGKDTIGNYPIIPIKRME